MIWGGSFIVTISHVQLTQILNGDVESLANTEFAGPDWIMDVALSPENINGFALITAHNTALQGRLDDISGVIVLDTPSSPSRSILYSAHLIWDSPAMLLVAAGTVFGEIITWTCDINGKSEVLHTFTGHEGSIFGVNISQPITFPDRTIGRLLASCSDDRTIRIWKLAPEVATVESIEERRRETGFGDKPAQAIEYGLLATIMGHASRIWDVKFVVESTVQEKHDRVHVLSFGEDSTTQYWELDLDSECTIVFSSESRPTGRLPTIGRLIHQKTFAFHGGKHIFSSALMSTSGQDYKLVTGGADGKISMYDIEPEVSETNSDLSAYWDLEDIIRSCHPNSKTEDPVQVVELAPIKETPLIDHTTDIPVKKPKAKKIPKDALNCYGFLSQNKFILTTNFGRVFTCTIGTPTRFQEVFLPAQTPLGLKSYALIEGFPELGVAFLAGADGRIYIYIDGHQLQEVANLGGKIADMFKIYDRVSDRFQLLVTVLGSHLATLFGFGNSSDDEMRLENMYEYQLPEKFVVTSAGKINGLLVLGSRIGSLAVYYESEAPLSIWTRPLDSAPESITTIIPIPSGHNPSTHFLTTDREGKFTIFSLSTNSSITSTFAILTPIHIGHPSFGPLVENAWFSSSSSPHNQNHELILYGFRSKSFVVWNHTRQYEISTVECGGAHRSYAYSPQSSIGGGGGHFVYTKSSKLHIHTQKTVSHTILKKGGHGREIKTSAVSPDHRYIATGAEDTEIRVWSYGSSTEKAGNGAGLRCQAIVQKHTAGIQHLQFHGSYLLSSGGYEEFFIFAISHIPNFGLGIVCEASNPEQTADRDLRIMGFDVSSYPGVEGNEKQEERMLITMVFSDSTFMSYVYSKTSGFTLIAKGRYVSSCLMQIKHLSVQPGQLHFLTAATDGCLVVWRHDLPSLSSLSTSTSLPDALTQISSVKVHQSSVKALDMTRSRDDRWIVIVTGGDDNAIAVTIYDMENLATRPKSFILRSAHAAAVTAVSFIPARNTSFLSGEEKFVFASSSNDQRVKQWEIILSSKERDDGGEEEGEGSEKFSLAIKSMGDVFTSVADVGDLSVLRCEGRDKVMVVGNGMEVWDVSS